MSTCQPGESTDQPKPQDSVWSARPSELQVALQEYLHQPSSRFALLRAQARPRSPSLRMRCSTRHRARLCRVATLCQWWPPHPPRRCAPHHSPASRHPHCEMRTLPSPVSHARWTECQVYRVAAPGVNGDGEGEGDTRARPREGADEGVLGARQRKGEGGGDVHEGGRAPGQSAGMTAGGGALEDPTSTCTKASLRGPSAVGQQQRQPERQPFPPGYPKRA